MAKGKRKVPDINSSSTADIAFLLLIFFLITTSMDTDRGLARLLPPQMCIRDRFNARKPASRPITSTKNKRSCEVADVYKRQVFTYI